MLEWSDIVREGDYYNNKRNGNKEDKYAKMHESGYDLESVAKKQKVEYIRLLSFKINNFTINAYPFTKFYGEYPYEASFNQSHNDKC